jgi:ABC-type transporter Mla MlaB component
MQDTVDPAAAPPRTPAQLIEDARRAELNVASLSRWPRRSSAGDLVTRLLEGRGEEAVGGPQVAHAGHEHHQGGPGPVQPPGVARSRPPGVRSSAHAVWTSPVTPSWKRGRGAHNHDRRFGSTLSYRRPRRGDRHRHLPSHPALPHGSNQRGNVQLAVDMSGVTFIDAAGIGVLVAAANRAREAGGGLSLLAPSPQVRRLLDVFHLDAILPAAQRSRGPFVAGSAA